MELIEVILSKENLNRAYKKVVANKGASGVDGVTVEELGDYIRKNREKIVTSLRNRTYIPKPVRRVYIPKDISKDLLENRIKDGAGLLNPLSYYLAKVGI